VAGNKVVLARPQTYMNQSGQSVSRLVRSLSINPKDLLVIHDDLDLALAKIRLSFNRIRVGIGRPDKPNPSEDDIIAYVLSDFTPEEKQTIAPVIPRVSEAILCLLTEGLTTAMNKFN